MGRRQVYTACQNVKRDTSRSWDACPACHQQYLINWKREHVFIDTCHLLEAFHLRRACAYSTMGKLSNVYMFRGFNVTPTHMYKMYECSFGPSHHTTHTAHKHPHHRRPLTDSSTIVTNIAGTSAVLAGRTHPALAGNDWLASTTHSVVPDTQSCTLSVRWEDRWSCMGLCAYHPLPREYRLKPDVCQSSILTKSRVSSTMNGIYRWTSKRTC